MMSRTNDRFLEEVRTGRISEVGDFILEYISINGADDYSFVEELVAIYFERLNNDEE